MRQYGAYRAAGALPDTAAGGSAIQPIEHQSEYFWRMARWWSIWPEVIIAMSGHVARVIVWRRADA
jgi:hypothetical protein